jgi:hypothetical protein
MQNRPRLSIALPVVLLLTSIYGHSSTAQENTTTESSPQPRRFSDVFLSSPNHTVALQFTALFLHPSSDNLHYAAEALPLPAPTPNWRIYEIHPDYHFGFDVDLDVIFHKANTNLMLNWEHFHSSDSSSKKVASEDMLGPFFEIGPNASPYNKAHGKVHFRFDEANVDYGLLVNFGDRMQANLFAGVSYAYIKETLTSKYFSPDDTYTRSIKVPSRFSGAGPQVGFNFSYRIIDGFHLTGDAAASLLVGSMKNHTSYKSVSPELEPLDITPPNKQSTRVTKRTQVVPGLEGKLGLAYSYTFRKHYMISLEAGYEAQIYINALQSVDMGSQVPLNSVTAASVGVFARTFQRSLSNFALAGPYITLSLGF